MKLNVPYFMSVSDTDCGPLALKMVLSFFGDERSFDEISKEEFQLETGMVWSMGIARAAAFFGYDVSLISQTNFSHEEDNIDYYEKYIGKYGMEVLKKLFEDIKKYSNLRIESVDLNLEDLKSKISKSCVAIVLVNWFELVGKEGFSGHFMPIVGFDTENVYLHNPGLAEPKAFMKVSNERFVRAWESKELIRI